MGGGGRSAEERRGGREEKNGPLVCENAVAGLVAALGALVAKGTGDALGPLVAALGALVAHEADDADSSATGLAPPVPEDARARAVPLVGAAGRLGRLPARRRHGALAARPPPPRRPPAAAATFSPPQLQRTRRLHRATASSRDPHRSASHGCAADCLAACAPCAPHAPATKENQFSA